MDIAKVQVYRKIAIVILAPLALFLALFTSTPLGEVAREVVHETGVILIIIGILFRTFATFFIGGKKNNRVVSDGVYSIVRNPLYTATFIASFGFGLQSSSVTLGVLFFLAIYFVFYIVVKKEEQHLTTLFGQNYTDYKIRTPRFLPKLSLWNSHGSVEVDLGYAKKTLKDASAFLIAIPLFGLIHQLQQHHILPILFYLP
jgi:protein-S-isoprenylcysteine O-methyltransferase Ste14